MVSLVPFSYEEVSLPPPTPEQAALIKLLEEAVKIEHERREEKRIAARRTLDQGRQRRHSPDEDSPKIEVPRCACGLNTRQNFLSGVS